MIISPPMEAILRRLHHVRHHARKFVDPATPSAWTPVAERRTIIQRQTAALLDGIPEAAPLHLVNSLSNAYTTATSVTEGLLPQANVDIHAHGRWFPTEGISGFSWSPAIGNANPFNWESSSAPYIDDVPYRGSFGRDIDYQAMIFDGTGWMQSAVNNTPEFGWIVVAKIKRPPTRGWQDLLASPSGVADPSRATDTTLRYSQGRLETYVDGRVSTGVLHPPISRGQTRPVIIAWSENIDHGVLGYVSAHHHRWVEYKRPTQRPNFQGQWFLGVNGGSQSTDDAARMDLYEIAYYDTYQNRGSMREHCRKLEGVYGIRGW